MKAAVDTMELVKAQDSLRRQLDTLDYTKRFYRKNFENNLTAVRKFFNDVRKGKKHRIGLELFKRLNFRLESLSLQLDKEKQFFSEIFQKKILAFREDLRLQNQWLDLRELPREVELYKNRVFQDKNLDDLRRVKKSKTDLKELRRLTRRIPSHLLRSEFQQKILSIEEQPVSEETNISMIALEKELQYELKRTRETDPTRVPLCKDNLGTLMKNSIKKYYKGDNRDLENKRAFRRRQAAKMIATKESKGNTASQDEDALSEENPAKNEDSKRKAIFEEIRSFLKTRLTSELLGSVDDIGGGDDLNPRKTLNSRRFRDFGKPVSGGENHSSFKNFYTEGKIQDFFNTSYANPGTASSGNRQDMEGSSRSQTEDSRTSQRLNHLRVTPIKL